MYSQVAIHTCSSSSRQILMYVLCIYERTSALTRKGYRCKILSTQFCFIKSCVEIGILGSAKWGEGLGQLLLLCHMTRHRVSVNGLPKTTKRFTSPQLRILTRNKIWPWINRTYILRHPLQWSSLTSTRDSKACRAWLMQDSALSASQPASARVP